VRIPTNGVDESPDEGAASSASTAGPVAGEGDEVEETEAALAAASVLDASLAAAHADAAQGIGAAGDGRAGGVGGEGEEARRGDVDLAIAHTLQIASGNLSCDVPPWNGVRGDQVVGRLTVWHVEAPLHQQNVSIRCYMHSSCSVSRRRLAVSDHACYRWLYEGRPLPPGTGPKSAEARAAREEHLAAASRLLCRETGAQSFGISARRAGPWAWPLVGASRGAMPWIRGWGGDPAASSGVLALASVASFAPVRPRRLWRHLMQAPIMQLLRAVSRSRPGRVLPWCAALDQVARPRRCVSARAGGNVLQPREVTAVEAQRLQEALEGQAFEPLHVALRERVVGME